jgi:hypothetical protein
MFDVGFLPGEKELRTKGQQFLNLLGAVDPAQGIMRGMAASGRAFDTDLPPEERRAAGIEAALETLAPIGMGAVGMAAKQPIKQTVMDILTVTGAPSSMARDPGVVARGGEPLDPSRRKFMAGLASLPVAASVAPDILSDLGTKVSKGAAKVSTNALDSAAANMDALKKMILDLEIRRDDAVFSDIDDFAKPVRDMTSSEADKFNQSIAQYDQSIKDIDTEIDISEFELRDQMNEMFDFIIDDPEILKGAADDTLETLAKEFYDNSKQIISGSRVQSMSADARMPFEELAKEIRRRGLDAKKTESGMNQYSYSKTFAADILDPKPDPWSEVSAADRTVTRYEEGGSVMSDSALRVFPREASEQMGDIEYEVDMQSYLHDPLSRLGFDPKKIRVGDPRSEDHYSRLSDIVTMDPNYGLFSRETQAHEFRHRGLQRLLEDYFMSDPGQFKRQYGKPAFDLMVKIHKQQRRRGPVEDRVHERIAEMFQRPDEFSLGTVYETSDARVFQTLADAEAYARENPGVEFRASEVRPNVEDTIETPRVNEFRDYMINKLRGETMRGGTDAEFEAVRAIQNAASDILVGKYATGGRVTMGLGSMKKEML